jgi:hypothetical protein
VKEGEILFFAILAAHAYAFQRETDLFRGNVLQKRISPNEHWRVCIELDDDDRALLISSRSAELGTRAVVRRSGILDLLPAGLEDSWQRFGIALEDNVIDTWHRESVPIIAKGGHKLWIIPGV